jgi:hypothetical protein
VPDTLCLVSGPRTGVRHLLTLAANFKELRPMPELFASLEARLDPGAALDLAEAAAQASGQRVLAYPLLPDTLAPEAVESVLLSRRNVRLLLVVRRQIDAYVSWCKAVELGAWREADTTDLRLTLDPDDFAAWLDAQENWYRHWRQWLERRHLPAPVLRYETEIDQPPLAALKRLSAAARQVGVLLRVPAKATLPGLDRQDRSRAIADKVANWPEFSRALIARGLEKRAFGHPA